MFPLLFVLWLFSFLGLFLGFVFILFLFPKYCCLAIGVLTWFKEFLRCAPAAGAASPIGVPTVVVMFTTDFVCEFLRFSYSLLSALVTELVFLKVFLQFAVPCGEGMRLRVVFLKVFVELVVSSGEGMWFS